MAFASSELSLMGYNGAVSGGYRVYHYANSAADTITAANFFDAAENQIGTGDLMFSGNGMYKLTNTSGAISLNLINTDPA